VEVSVAEHLKGNVYKAVVTSLEQGLQAAFVDFGHKKNGFLPIQDIMPEHYQAKPKGRRATIKEALVKGQEIVVQVDHDPRGTKGARLTSYVSIPGRYLVIMPGRDGVGISRKIEDREARENLKDAFKSLKVPKKTGFIVRTVGIGHSADELGNDLKYLSRLWDKIKREAKKAEAPSLIYKEEDIAVRTVRDYLTDDVTEVLVDDRQAFQSIKAFLKRTMPWRTINVTHYREKEPLFDRHNLEDQISRLNDRNVILPSRGYLVIDKTEALTAIDVNSGRSKKDKDIEALALRTNMEAAEEAARQLRLRDIGGLIVIDFIDMVSEKNRAKVEEQLHGALALDKAHYDITRISRTAYFEATSKTCPTCAGVGVLKSPELVAVSALRDIHSRVSAGGLQSLTCRLPVESANYLMNTLRESLQAMEDEFSVRIGIVADPSLPPGEVSVERAATEKAKKKGAGPEKEETKETGEGKPKKTRRRRRKTAKKEETGEQEPETKEAPEAPAKPDTEEGKPKRTRRRRRRTAKQEQAGEPSAGEQEPETREAAEPSTKPDTEEGKPKKTRRRRRRTAKKEEAAEPPAGEKQPGQPETKEAPEAPARRPRKRRPAAKKTAATKRPSRGVSEAETPEE
jgi:ribonuclease E